MDNFTSTNPGEARLWLVDEESIYLMDIEIPEDIQMGLEYGVTAYWQAFLIFTAQSLKDCQNAVPVPLEDENGDS